MSDGQPKQPLSRWGAAAPAVTVVSPAPDPELRRLMDLYEAAVANVFRGRADLARGPVAELMKAMPHDKGFAHLARETEVVGFEWPAARSSLVISRREPPAQADIDLVIFHVDLPGAPSGVHGTIDYASVLGLSFEAMRIKAPAARRVLLTDEKTSVPDSLAVDAVMRFPIDTALPMFERMRVEELYLSSRAPERASVLLDSDIVVNADPCRIFVEAFDIGLTWRSEYADAPFNGGVIFVSEGDAGAAFFRKALACYEALAADATLATFFPKSIQAWWGDQFAYGVLVGYREFAARANDALSVDGLRLRFFPCSDYNFTPEDNRNYTFEELKRKLFIHFKGNRKQVQSHYLGLMRAGQV